MIPKITLFTGKRNKQNTFLCFVLIFVFCFRVSFAQNFRNFSSLTGKRDVAVNCMVQGLDGDFWIGTAAGLVTYDGQDVKFFNKENGLVDDNVTALYITADHTLWIGHKNGKITILKGGKFFSFSKNDKLTDEPVYAFAEGDGMWIATYGSGIFRFRNNELEPFNSEKGLSDDFVYTLYNDHRGHLWAGTDAGITRINLGEKITSFAVYAMKEGLPDNIVRQLAGDNNGDIWIAMQDSGLCRFDTKELHFTPVKIAENWRYGAISSLDFDTAGSLYVGTKKNGVIRYAITADGREVLEVIDANSGLLSNEVNDVFTDREKNLWVATAKGLSEMRHSRLSFLNTKNGLLSDKVEAILQDSRGDYWIATDKGTMRYSFLPDGEVRVKNYFLTEGMLEEQVICMHEDQKGNLWFGTYGRGVYMLSPSSDKPVNFDKSKGLADNNISAISSGKDGILWFATQGGGITRMDPAQNFAMKNYSSQNGLSDDYVFSVLSDSKGRLWVGMDGGGIAMREAGSEQFVNISEKNNLKGKTVYTIKEDKKGNIWFSASASGIYKFDGSAFTNYSVKNGLRDNDPSILSPAFEELVLVHNKGIDVLNIADGSVKYFSISDNDVEPNLNAGFTDREGNVWIGTNSGTVRFRPYNVPADSITPMIHLDGLMVQFQPYPLDSARDFSWRQNNFIFNFSSIWFRSDEKVKFRYKLVGSDSSYFETQNNTASYPSLPAGFYTFLVSAANNEGKWGPPVQYSFTIATPLWQRWWFWVLSLGTVTAAVYAFVQYRLRALHKEKQVLEEKVRERTAEIEAKNKELERLSIVARETGNVIIIMDDKGKLEWVNYSFEKVNDITLDELKKLKGESIFEISNNPEIKNIIDTCMREKRSIVYESKNILRDGRVIWESSTLTPIYDEAGNLRKLIIIDTDVTEQKKNEEIIRQKNKDITDSIEYAKKIQTSILPPLAEVKEALPQSFVMYMQKDIVSGDFYWFARKGDEAIIAVVDCTGHGVPGAFMSLIGNNILNQVVNEHEITEPAAILDGLNKGVINALYHNAGADTSKDGMDAAICNINLRTKVVQFAGAMRPLYIFRKEGFEEVKGDKMPIGTREGDREYEIKFTTQTIQAGNGEKFYISSDGYADQFGGGSGKKMMTKNFKQVLGRIKDMEFEDQKKELVRYHREWKGDFEQVDDILVIGFTV